MTPTRIHRYYLIASPAARPTVVALCQQLGDGPPEAEAENCRTQLSPASDPTGPVVAYCMSIPVGESTKQFLESLPPFDPAEIAWIRCDALGETEGVCRASNHPAGIAAIGLHFDLPTALNTLGLAMHREPEIVLVDSNPKMGKRV